MKPAHTVGLLLVVVGVLALGLIGMAVRGPEVVTQQEYVTQFESVPTTETVMIATTQIISSTLSSFSQIPQTTGGSYLCYSGTCNWYYWFSGYIGQSGECVGQTPPCISQCVIFTTNTGIYYLDNLPTRHSSGYVTIYGYVEPGPYQGCAGWYLVIYVQSIT